jgi:hypothetical protein
VGTFAETASIDYCFLFADLGKQTPFSSVSNKQKFVVSVFCFEQTNGSYLFLLLSYTYTYIETAAYTYRYAAVSYIYMHSWALLNKNLTTLNFNLNSFS